MDRNIRNGILIGKLLSLIKNMLKKEKKLKNKNCSENRKSFHCIFSPSLRRNNIKLKISSHCREPGDDE